MEMRQALRAPDLETQLGGLSDLQTAIDSSDNVLKAAKASLDVVPALLDILEKTEPVFMSDAPEQVCNTLQCRL
jgi:hypothetical protein